MSSPVCIGGYGPPGNQRRVKVLKGKPSNEEQRTSANWCSSGMLNMKENTSKCALATGLMMTLLFCPMNALAVPADDVGIERELEVYPPGDAFLLAADGNSEGTGMAAWSVLAGNTLQLVSSRYIVPWGWTNPRPVGEGTRNETGADVSVGESGSALTSWVEFDGGGPQGAYVAAFSLDRGWGTPFRLDAGGAGLKPVVAAGSDDGGVALWAENIGGNTSVFSRTYSPVTGWAPSVRVSTIPSRATEVEIADVLNGSAWGMWIDGTGRPRILGSLYVEGSGWGAPVTISSAPPGYSYSELEIVGAPSGKAMVVWLRTNNASGLRETVSSTYESSTGWGSATLLSTNSTALGIAPRVAYGGSDAFYIAYGDRVGGNDQLFVVSSTSIATPTPPSGLSNSANVAGSWISASLNGGAIVGWIEPSLSREVVQAARIGPTGDYLGSALVSKEGLGDALAVAGWSDRDGNAVVSWIEERQGQRVVLATTIREEIAPVLYVLSPADGTQLQVPTVLVDGRAEAGAIVSANGVQGRAGTNGSFQLLVPLAPGNNTILIEAVDASGNRNYVIRNVVLEVPWAGLYSAVASIQANVSLVRQDLEAAVLNVTLIQSRLQSLGLEIGDATDDLADATSRLEAIESNENATEEQLADARDNITSSLGRLASLQYQMNATLEELDTATLQLDSTEARLEAVERSIDIMNGAENGTAQKLSRTSSQVATFESDLAIVGVASAVAVMMGSIGLVLGTMAFRKAVRIGRVDENRGEQRGPRPPSVP